MDPSHCSNPFKGRCDIELDVRKVFYVLGGYSIDEET